MKESSRPDGGWMPRNTPVLSKHNLAHLGELRIDEQIFRARYGDKCATSRCNGVCCHNGVWVDVAERDTILRNADLVREHMEPGQDQNPQNWFDTKVWEHTDFPSGRALATHVSGGACTFLNSAKRCVLQKASRNLPVSLKPFFCYAFPVTIDDGRLELEEGYRPECCAPVGNGVLDAFEVCGGELKHVLGEEGASELKQLATPEPTTHDCPPGL
jgi:hypothetical protein